MLTPAQGVAIIIGSFVFTWVILKITWKRSTPKNKLDNNTMPFVKSELTITADECNTIYVKHHKLGSVYTDRVYTYTIIYIPGEPTGYYTFFNLKTGALTGYIYSTLAQLDAESKDSICLGPLTNYFK